MEPVKVAIRRIPRGGEPLPLPAYMSPGAAGMDVFADVSEPMVIAPLGRALVPTGFALAVPPGYEAQLRMRSGLALRHGLAMPNAPGTIDADYRGEVQVLVVNLGTEPFTVRRGERIAQLVVCPVARVAWEEVDALDDTPRGPGGFGSTGR